MLHKSKYQEIKFDDKLQAISNYWTTESEEMSNEDFMQESLKWLECYQIHKPKNILADTRYYKFTITPEVQEWHAENIFKKLMSFGPKKMAMLVSSDIFAQVSIEQTIEEGDARTSSDFQTKYFETKEEAQNWLVR